MKTNKHSIECIAEAVEQLIWDELESRFDFEAVSEEKLYAEIDRVRAAIGKQLIAPRE
jgi:hypothetical protein